MAHSLPNKFSQYALSLEELALAAQFTTLQRYFIQNEIAIAAQEKIALKFDPQNPLSFAQQEAELAGKIGILEYLLTAAEMYPLIPTNPENERE